MRRLLDMALKKAATLPDAEQDRIAQLVLDEIEDEARWQATFAGSQDKLCGCSAARARVTVNRPEEGTSCPDGPSRLIISCI
jgi:hypothetical protein